ncbi:MAG: hypothetical protein KDG50_16090 [Chromatiales bacterium]|nr:hypothetical protein [Chromatiales bacterium]
MQLPVRIAPFVLALALIGAAAHAESPIQVDPRLVAADLYIEIQQEPARGELEFALSDPAPNRAGRWPVRGAIPFHRGELRSTRRLRLTTTEGVPVDVQGFATAYWPDGSIRWLCIDFVTPEGPALTRGYRFEWGRAVPSLDVPTDVQAGPDRVRVPTAAGPVVISRDEDLLAGGAVGPIRAFARIATDGTGTGAAEHRFTAESLSVLETGPVQVSVRVSGHYGDERSAFSKLHWRYPASFVLRVYRSIAHVEAQHAFGFNGDEYRDFVQSYGLKMIGAGPLSVGADAKSIGLGAGDRVVQHDAQTWKSMHREGRHLDGWAAGGSTLAVIRDGWRNWPIAFARDADHWRVELLGESDGRALDLRYEEAGNPPRRMVRTQSMEIGDRLTTEYLSEDDNITRGRAAGLVRVHEFVLRAGTDASAAVPGAAAQFPLVPALDPQRVRSTRALGDIAVYDRTEYEAQRRYYGTMLDILPVAHEALGLYGFVDWGDVPMLDVDPPDGFHPLFSGGFGWVNGERAVEAWPYHYAAGGGRRYFDFARAAVHHTLGIDAEHPGGDDLAGSFHRHNQVHWRHNEINTRMGGARGWYAYYWLSGDRMVEQMLGSVGPDSPARIQRIDLREATPNPVVGYDYQDCADHTLVHLAWITTGDPRYARAHPGLVRLWKHAAEAGVSTARTAVRMTIEGDEPKGFELDPSIGPLNHYWFTYGCDDFLLDWAALAGDAAATDALLALGRKFWLDRTPVFLYQSAEALYLALAALTADSRLPARFSALRHQRRGLGIAGLAGPDTRTVDSGQAGYRDGADWVSRGVWVYGKNGIQINAAGARETLLLARAQELFERGGAPVPIPIERKADVVLQLGFGGCDAREFADGNRRYEKSAGFGWISGLDRLTEPGDSLPARARGCRHLRLWGLHGFRITPKQPGDYLIEIGGAYRRHPGRGDVFVNDRLVVPAAALADDEVEWNWAGPVVTNAAGSIDLKLWQGEGSNSRGEPLDVRLSYIILRRAPAATERTGEVGSK